jgi:hypothetical protein
MAATFEWKVLSIACYPQLGDKTNVVFTIYWSCTGVENGYSAFVERNTRVSYKDGDTFIEYDQLTESQVLDWVWNEVVQTIKGQNGQPDTLITRKDATETEIQDNIDKQINPPVIFNPLPW